MNISVPFVHQQSAHCESGVTSNLLKHHGIDCSEAMAFGIGEGLFFAYLPFIKVNKLPLTTYRCAVGNILNKVTKKLSVTLVRQKFRRPGDAMEALDAKLAEGIPVGCQTGAYWLPYFPPAFRFHFNMHNLVVIGKEEDEYIISDPVFEETVRCPSANLAKARFAKGALSPRGSMYYIESVSSAPDIENGARLAIKAVSKTMLNTPVFFLGVRGINFLAGRLEKWPKRVGEERAKLLLGQLVRMQEEIGTGGAGFRFMYAAFLQEASRLLNLPELQEVSSQMTETGDQWRQFAVAGARICKGRPKSGDTYEYLAQTLKQCADRERDCYSRLMQAVN